MLKIFLIAKKNNSAVSSQAMVGVPTDVYLTGAMMFWWIVSVAIGVPIAAYIYLPLFQDLGLLSITQVKESEAASIYSIWHLKQPYIVP